jgi:hypothetical protein
MHNVLLHYVILMRDLRVGLLNHIPVTEQAGHVPSIGLIYQ